MSEFLDNIDAVLEEVEEQLLGALQHFRQRNPDAGYCTLEPEFKDALRDAVSEVAYSLENSGDEKRLELRTERHEVIHARIVTLKQILNADIPVACLRQAHRELKDSRERLENRVLARRRKLEPSVTMKDRRESSVSLKGLFNRDVGAQELDRNPYLVTEQEARELEDVEEFLDGGIYSASRELAMLANLIHRGATNRPRPEQPRGRAVFEARDLTTSIPPVTRTRPAAEPKQVQPQPKAEPETKPKKESAENADKSGIAKTPEEIRRKLEQRKYQSSGKASFDAKDIEPEQPREFYGRRRAPQEENRKDKDGGNAGQKEEQRDKPGPGKAVFESRELSRSPWEKK